MIALLECGEVGYSYWPKICRCRSLVSRWILLSLGVSQCLSLSLSAPTTLPRAGRMCKGRLPAGRGGHTSVGWLFLNEAGSYLRLIDSCITQRQAQGPSRTRNKRTEEEQGGGRVLVYRATSLIRKRPPPRTTIGPWG